MKKPRLCYCPKGTTCYPSDECPNKPTTLENICVCGNRGYSALVNNEHFKDCPNYKPTTLREEFLNQENLYEYWDITDPETIADWWLSKIDSHNTELIKKIEGLKENNTIAYDYGSDGAYCYEKALDEVINLINQEK